MYKLIIIIYNNNYNLYHSFHTCWACNSLILWALSASRSDSDILIRYSARLFEPTNLLEVNVKAETHKLTIIFGLSQKTISQYKSINLINLIRLCSRYIVFSTHFQHWCNEKQEALTQISGLITKHKLG